MPVQKLSYEIQMPELSLSLLSLQCLRHTGLLAARDLHFCPFFIISLAVFHISPLSIFSAVQIYFSFSLLMLLLLCGAYIKAVDGKDLFIIFIMWPIHYHLLLSIYASSYVMPVSLIYHLNLDTS